MRTSAAFKIATGALILGLLGACGNRDAAETAPKAAAVTAVPGGEDPVEDYPVPPKSAPGEAARPSGAGAGKGSAGSSGGSVKDDPKAKDALVGSWAAAKEACNSGEAIRFSSDGTYGFEGENGKWALAGDSLRFDEVKVFDEATGAETEGDPSVVKLLEVGAEKMAWEAPSGAKQDYVRCPGIQ